MGFGYTANQSCPMYCSDDVVGGFEGVENVACIGSWQPVPLGIHCLGKYPAILVRFSLSLLSWIALAVMLV